MTHYTVDALLENLLRTAIVGVMNDCPEEITIEGNVSQVSHYGDKTYFKLKGAGRHISARCSKDLAPNEGRNIVFKGTVSCKTDDYTSGVNIFITGRPEGAYTPIFEKKVLDNDDYECKDHTSLSNLVSNLKYQRIVVVGSKTAHKDIKAVVTDTFFEVDYKIVTISKKEEVKKYLKRLKDNNNYKAMVFARGGNESSMGEVWDDPLIVRTLLDFNMPYYTALGHADSVTLSDKFASEMFISPTDFGHALSKSIEDYNQNQNILNTSSNRAKVITEKDDELKLLGRELQNSTNRISQELEEFEAIISKKKASYSKLLTGSLIFIFLLLSIIGLVVFFLYKNDILLKSFDLLKMWVLQLF